MTVSTFDANVRSQGNIATIDLVGEINAFAEEALNQAYTEAERYAPSHIVLNFTKVHYINSTGIALIVSLLSRTRKSNRQLAVYGLSDHYQEIFQITRLADFVSIFPDETSVLSAVR